MYVSILMSRDQKGPLVGHVMHGHCNVGLSDLVELHGACPRPELNSGVPASADNEILISLGVRAAVDILDGVIMGTNCSHLV